eukprot:1791366-Rhodomonas_salina.3
MAIVLRTVFGMLLRACYGESGTDGGYAATAPRPRQVSDEQPPDAGAQREWFCTAPCPGSKPLLSAMPSPVLTQQMALQYCRPTRCPVLRQYYTATRYSSRSSVCGRPPR